MNVSAQDKATGKQQSIVIKASSGLSDEEIENMVRDAEEHAVEDAKLRGLIDKRNQGEQLIHASEKSMSDLADQMEEGEKADIDAKIVELREAIAGEDEEAIDVKTAALGEATGKLAERAYAKQNEEAGEAGAPEESDENSVDDAVDAEFEEVKEDKAS